MPQQPPLKKPPPKPLFEPILIPTQGNGIRIYQCTKCWSLVSAQRLSNHEDWHDRQQRWIREMLESFKWPVDKPV